MKVTFTAQLKPTGKAIKLDADNSGEVTLTFPGTEIAEVIKMTLFSGKAVTVTVEDEEYHA